MIFGFVKDYGNISVKSSLPCFEDLQIACCENFRNITGYGCQRSAFLVTVVTWGIFFVV